MDREPIVLSKSPTSTTTEIHMDIPSTPISFYPQDTLTLKEVAANLRINPGTVYNWIYAGHIPSLKLRRVRRVKAEVVKEIQENDLK